MNVQGPLDELAVWLCTPARSGIYLTKADLIALARSTDTSLRVGERAWMLADILKSSPDADALAARLDRLRVFAERSVAEWDELAAQGAGEAMAGWAERARGAVRRLEEVMGEVRL